MARPRKFNEDAVLDAAVQCFWSRGYEATSIRDLIEKTGLAGASLYNAFGDKRAIYQRALDHYVEGNIGKRIRHCETMEPSDAIEAFFAEIVKRSLDDKDLKGCMLVNAVLDVAPHDPRFQEAVVGMLSSVEAFFLRCVSRGQAEGSITTSHAAEDLARHLLCILMGVRVLARVGSERALLEGAVRPTLALLVPGSDGTS
ncbi:TetR/AcrR family transcriptional regulator [Roseovarius sp.]|uniref:TetR/AcrR family transcriptional regulator n=1 Tax=Roseovarius sp. TaxID=1486281 RepID=UPI003A98729B